MTNITGFTRAAPGAGSARRIGWWPKAATRLLGVAGLALALASCNQSSSSSRVTSMQVDLSALNWGDSAPASAASSSPMSARLRPDVVTGPGNTATTTYVLSLVIGAVVITFQDAPLGENTPITDALKDSLKNDVINSVKYFQLVQLPTSTPTVEFAAPPATAGHWQVAVIGLPNTINVLQDLSNTIDSQPPVYFGFNLNPDKSGDGVFLTTDAASGATVNMTMRRACVVNHPPLGCATFMPTAGSAAQVTSGVEVVGVETQKSGEASFTLRAPVGGVVLPIVVRASGGNNPCANTAGAVSICSPAGAIAALSTGWPELGLSGRGVAGTRLNVKTTHMLSTGQPAFCSATSTSGTPATVNANLIANCAEDAVYTDPAVNAAPTTAGTLAGTEDYPMIY